MDEETLIVEVQNHRIIYDKFHPFYKDNRKKDEAWNTIAGVLGVDADLCKAKWRSLRDGFVKNRKKASAGGSAGGSQREWRYSEIMAFISPYVQPKRNLSSALEERSSTPVSASGSDEQTPSGPQDGQGVSLLRPTSPGSGDRPHRSRSPGDRGSRHPRKSHRPQTSDVEERLLSILQEPLPKPVSDLDECYHFAMCLIPTLHRLDENRRQRAKIEILTLLQNIENSIV